MQQGDVQLVQTVDGGDITSVNGVITMGSGLGTAAYLSLFGGSETDAGGSDTRLQFWGNFSETELAKKYRSETQNLLQSIPATAANLLKIEAAAGRDLAWFVEVGAATVVEVLATIPARNKILVTVSIIADGDAIEFPFLENWKAEL